MDDVRHADSPDESRSRSRETAPRSAAFLVIGTELLTGKIEDRNVPVLARELFGLGVALRRVVIVEDEVETIAAELDDLRSEHDYVFTSGGVGPTHDDVTMRAVARSFGVGLERAEPLADLLRGYFGERLRDEHLRMADVPASAELVISESVRWPTVEIDGVFVLPGLPEVFEMKMPLLREHLGASRPFVSRAVSTASEEAEIATLLETLEEEHPSVRIGSYPRWGDGPERVRVTFDGRDPEAVERAAASFADALGDDRRVAS